MTPAFHHDVGCLKTTVPNLWESLDVFCCTHRHLKVPTGLGSLNYWNWKGRNWAAIKRVVFLRRHHPGPLETESAAGMRKRSESKGDPSLRLHCRSGKADQTEQSPQSSLESAYREAIVGRPKREAWHMAFWR